jgi:hypothetical protein
VSCEIPLKDNGRRNRLNQLAHQRRERRVRRNWRDQGNRAHRCFGSDNFQSVLASDENETIRASPVRRFFFHPFKDLDHLFDRSDAANWLLGKRKAVRICADESIVDEDGRA